MVCLGREYRLQGVEDWYSHVKYHAHVLCRYTHCWSWICPQVLANWQGESHWENNVANNGEVGESGDGWSLWQLVSNFSTVDPLLVFSCANEFSSRLVVPHRSL